MAAATEDRVDVYRLSKGYKKNRPVGVDEIFKHTGIIINAAGFAVPAANTASSFNAGVALEAVDNSAGSAGDKFVLVDEGGAEILVTQTDGSQTIANVGDPAFWADDKSVANAGNVLAGEISEVVDADTVWVRLKPFGVAS